MAVTGFTKIYELPYELSQIQERSEQATRQLRQYEQARGVSALGIVLPAPPGTVEVVHRLGRKPIGFFVTNARAASGAWAYEQTVLDTNRLVLRSTGAAGSGVTLDLWVY